MFFLPRHNDGGKKGDTDTDENYTGERKIDDWGKENGECGE